MPPGFVSFVVEVPKEKWTQKLESRLLRVPGEAHAELLLHVDRPLMSSVVRCTVTRRDEGTQFRKECEAYIEESLRKHGVARFSLNSVGGGTVLIKKGSE